MRKRGLRIMGMWGLRCRVIEGPTINDQKLMPMELAAILPTYVLIFFVNKPVDNELIKNLLFSKQG